MKYVFLNDLSRMLRSKRIYLSIIGVILVVWLSISQEVKALWVHRSGSVFYLASIRRGFGSFFMTFMVLSVLPYGLSVWEDRKHHYVNYVMTRTSLIRYVLSKWIVTFLGTILAITAGYLIAYGILSVFIPVFPKETVSTQTRFGDLARQKSLLFFPLEFSAEASGYAFLAVFAMASSFFMENVFLILSMPFLLYYFCFQWSHILNLPVFFQWPAFLTGLARFGGRIGYGWQSWFLTVLYFFLLSAFCVPIMIWKLGKEHQG